jgi:pimeloyl-ACP methyl ester carboxylesterase
MSDFVFDSLLAVTIVFAILAAVSFIGIARLEAAHPPSGRFIEVQGVRLHVVMLGPDPASRPAQPAIVLIHGATGNLEDMRLALGEKLSTTHHVILIDRPGHGWSSRPQGRDSASPARQAELVAGALEQLGVRKAIMIGHSWGGALATAFALAFPERTAGLVLLSAPTHPWPGNPGWYNKLALAPYIGPLFVRTCVYPLGLLLSGGISRSVFEPQSVPDDYVRRAAIPLVLRPRTFYSNAIDLAFLESFVAALVPRYLDLRAPTVIVTGDSDPLVSWQTNGAVLAATLPRAKLVLLRNVGHMSHHAAPEVIVAAVDELMSSAA